MVNQGKGPGVEEAGRAHLWGGAFQTEGARAQVGGPKEAGHEAESPHASPRGLHLLRLNPFFYFTKICWFPLLR